MGLSAEQRERQRQRIEDCRELYLKHGGEDHELIEHEMRAMGHRDFHRRILYRRYERGNCDTGWIERFGWNRLLPPPSTGGAALPPDERKGYALPEGPNNISGGSASNAGIAPDSFSDTDGKAEPYRSSFGHSPEPPIDYSLNFDEFKEWLQSRTPSLQWNFKHQVYIYKRLRKVFDGDLDRLMIFMPPRHGKSELVTKHFTAYFLKHNPEKKVIIGCYNQQLANKFSRGIKNIHLQDKFLEAEARGEKEPVFETTEASEGVATTVRSRIADAAGCMLSSNSQLSTVNYQLAFRPRNAEAEWETPEGGGVRAVGVGAGITGYGANLIIIDDPTRSRADANSATYREKVWDWFNDDVTTRLEPDGKMILIQTRWHEDDLAGRLLKQMNEEGGEHWEVIDLPALATQPKKDKSDKSKEMNYETNNIQPRHQTYYILNGRQVPVHTLGQPKSTGTATAAVPPDERKGCALPGGSQYVSGGSASDEWRDELGRREGQALWPERFPEQKLEKIKRQMGSYSFAALYQQTPVPAEGGLFKRAWFKTVPYLPPNLKKKRGWDLGISKNLDADYTASAGVAYDNDGNMYIYDVIRRRIEYPEQRKLILGRIQKEPDTEHGIEASANGNAVIQDLRREQSIRGTAIREIKPDKDKVSRAISWIALAESGCVYLVRGPWNNEFIDEACSFPLGTHDDQIDAVSLAVALHTKYRHTAMGA